MGNFIKKRSDQYTRNQRSILTSQKERTSITFHVSGCNRTYITTNKLFWGEKSEVIIKAIYLTSLQEIQRIEEHCRAEVENWLIVRKWEV